MPSLLLQTPTASLVGEVRLSGSKSYTNRALVLAALAQGESVLEAASLSDDSHALIGGLRQLGVAIDIDINEGDANEGDANEGAERVVVQGTGGALGPWEGTIDIGPAGTSMRFLTSVCALATGCRVTLCGSERMHQRPIGDLVGAWRQLGGAISYLGTEGCPPLAIEGVAPDTLGRQVAMAGQTSSQFMTSLLLASPLLPHGLTLDVVGQQISRSYIDMTCSVMEGFGVEVTNYGYQRYHVAPGQQITPCTYQVEGDASGGSYLWGLAAVSGGRIRVHNADPASRQGDLGFPGLLEAMGCRVDHGEADGVPWIEVEGGPLVGIDVDMSQMPDTSMTLAVIAACAQGTTRITGLGTLRHKETDRLAALQAELRAVGIDSETTADSITIHGGRPHGASIKTYEDHRMAMSFALLGAVTDGVVIQEPAVVGKSFPDFWDKLASLGLASAPT